MDLQLHNNNISNNINFSIHIINHSFQIFNSYSHQRFTSQFLLINFRIYHPFINFNVQCHNINNNNHYKYHQGQYSQVQQQVEENKISKKTEERIRQIQNIKQEPFDKASQNLSSLDQFAHEEQMNNDDVDIENSENSLIEFDLNEEISQESVSENKTLIIGQTFIYHSSFVSCLNKYCKETCQIFSIKNSKRLNENKENTIFKNLMIKYYKFKKKYQKKSIKFT